MLTGGQRSANMSAMTTLSEALPPVADGEMRYTPWNQIDVRSPQFNVFRTLLTPEGAREWLKHNLVNRPLDPVTVRALRRAVKVGEWQSFDPFLFCEPSGVVSCAHRLTAIAAEGRAVEVLVQVGVSEEVRWMVDTHRARMHAQNLSMRGYSNPRSVSALAAAVWKLEQFGFIRQAGALMEKPRHAELDELLLRHPEILRYAEIAWQTYWKLDRRETPTVLGLALWMMTRGSDDQGAAIEFMRQLAFEPPTKPLALATEEDEPVTPAAMLRRRLVSPGYVKAGKSELTRVTAVIEAWNAWVRGDSEWVPPHLEQAASMPKVLQPGNEYPALLLEAQPGARSWRPHAA